ncbi:MAG: DinB family protein [Casimicrobiaceae bacterium]
MLDALSHHFATMAYNNAWSNHRLLAAIGRLPHAGFTAARVSFFPSIKATLNHIVTVDWYYIDALERALANREPNREPHRFFEPEEPFDTCAALTAAQREADRRLVTACTSLTDDRLELPVPVMRGAGLQNESATRLLAHLFQHQIHHRGQAHAMLAGTGVAPPQLDEFFCANEAHLRAAELAELGYSEAMIWNTPAQKNRKP